MTIILAKHTLNLDIIIGRAVSINKVSIRLTHERLVHITHNHPELAGQTFDILEAITSPNFIVRGRLGEYYAVKKVNTKHLIVIYKEEAHDGFVITSFVTSKIHQIKKKQIIWPK